ncbi:sodium channel protein type 4 subunit alpha A [Tachysurus ichikawai]
MAKMVPTTRTKVLHRFTPESLAQIEKFIEEQKAREESEDVDLETRPTAPSSDLEAGKTLPMIYGDPPEELLNTALEDIDPFYKTQKTFIIITKGNTIYRFNAEPSCYMISPFNLVRRAAIRVLTHSYP